MYDFSFFEKDLELAADLMWYYSLRYEYRGQQLFYSYEFITKEINKRDNITRKQVAIEQMYVHLRKLLKGPFREQLQTFAPYITDDIIDEFLHTKYRKTSFSYLTHCVSYIECYIQKYKIAPSVKKIISEIEKVHYVERDIHERTSFNSNRLLAIRARLKTIENMAKRFIETHPSFSDQEIMDMLKTQILKTKLSNKRNLKNRLLFVIKLIRNNESAEKKIYVHNRVGDKVR